MRKIPWRVLIYCLPLAFCYWLHQFALRGWFWQDDFAWLSLRFQVFDRATFLQTMFAPMLREQSGLGASADSSCFSLNSTAWTPFLIMHLQWVRNSRTCFCWRGSFGNWADPDWRHVSRRRFGPPTLPWWCRSRGLRTITRFSALFSYSRHLHCIWRDINWLQFAVFVLGFGALESILSIRQSC